MNPHDHRLAKQNAKRVWKRIYKNIRKLDSNVCTVRGFVGFYHSRPNDPLVRDVWNRMGDFVRVVELANAMYASTMSPLHQVFESDKPLK